MIAQDSEVYNPPYITSNTIYKCKETLKMYRDVGIAEQQK